MRVKIVKKRSPKKINSKELPFKDTRISSLYYVIQFLDSNYEGKRRFDCVPISWTKKWNSFNNNLIPKEFTSQNVVVVAYPDYHPSIVDQFVKGTSKPEDFRKWNKYLAIVRYSAATYNTAIKHLNSIRKEHPMIRPTLSKLTNQKPNYSVNDDFHIDISTNPINQNINITVSHKPPAQMDSSEINIAVPQLYNGGRVISNSELDPLTFEALVNNRSNHFVSLASSEQMNLNRNNMAVPQLYGGHTVNVSPSDLSTRICTDPSGSIITTPTLINKFSNHFASFTSSEPMDLSEKNMAESQFNAGHTARHAVKISAPSDLSILTAPSDSITTTTSINELTNLVASLGSSEELVSDRNMASEQLNGAFYNFPSNFTAFSDPITSTAAIYELSERMDLNRNNMMASLLNGGYMLNNIAHSNLAILTTPSNTITTTAAIGKLSNRVESQKFPAGFDSNRNNILLEQLNGARYNSPSICTTSLNPKTTTTAAAINEHSNHLASLKSSEENNSKRNNMAAPQLNSGLTVNNSAHNDLPFKHTAPSNPITTSATITIISRVTKELSDLVASLESYEKSDSNSNDMAPSLLNGEHTVNNSSHTICKASSNEITTSAAVNELTNPVASLKPTEEMVTPQLNDDNFKVDNTFAKHSVENADCRNSPNKHKLDCSEIRGSFSFHNGSINEHSQPQINLRAEKYIKEQKLIKEKNQPPVQKVLHSSVKNKNKCLLEYGDLLISKLQAIHKRLKVLNQQNPFNVEEREIIKKDLSEWQRRYRMWKKCKSMTKDHTEKKMTEKNNISDVENDQNEFAKNSLNHNTCIKSERIVELNNKIKKENISTDDYPNNSRSLLRYQVTENSNSQLTELVLGEGVYIDRNELYFCLSQAKYDYNTLMRLLVTKIFSDDALKEPLLNTECYDKPLKVLVLYVESIARYLGEKWTMEEKNLMNCLNT